MRFQLVSSEKTIPARALRERHGWISKSLSFGRSGSTDLGHRRFPTACNCRLEQALMVMACLAAMSLLEAHRSWDSQAFCKNLRRFPSIHRESCAEHLPKK